jgi:hypothetical protein
MMIAEKASAMILEDAKRSTQCAPRETEAALLSPV